MRSALARLEAEYAALVPPSLPRPVPPVESRVYQAWRTAFQAFTDRRCLIRAEIAALKGGQP